MANKHGGSRPGAGRRRLDGKKAGAGKYVLDKTVSLPPNVVEYLSQLGNGNLSLGVRMAAEFHRLSNQQEQASVTQEMSIENPCTEEAQPEASAPVDKTMISGSALSVA
jgi:predicted PilT family ATPase